MPDGVVIDSIEFSRASGSLAGEIAVGSLRRLADVVVAPSGMLQYSLKGVQRWDGKPGLVLEVTGGLELRCQRCLEILDFPLRVTSYLILVGEGELWPDEEPDATGANGESDKDDPDDEWDAIEASTRLVVSDLIEDEVLLALPIVPRHAACKSPVALDDEHESSPFAVLAKLKKH